MLAAYLGGSCESQLRSRVKRHDHYSGLLSLFQVYHAIREQDPDWEIDAVEDLIDRHEAPAARARVRRSNGCAPVR